MEPIPLPDHVEIISQWMDVFTVPKSHLIAVRDGDFAFAACGKMFPYKDLMEGDTESPKCKTCLRREIKMKEKSV